MFQNPWISVPAGQVVLEPVGAVLPDKPVVVAAFAMLQYPVTNEEFGRFMTAGGYGHSAWWDEVGWLMKEKGGWNEPAYWQVAEWNQAIHPVVGVSWYEARAYCRWLSQVTQQQVTLPDESQWQWAAQGNTGWEYPWGNELPNGKLCNWNREVDGTTPVTQYPPGGSPFGIMDMCGNVWEWCLTEGERGLNGRQTQLLRGGSWSSDSLLSLRVANRNPKDPNTRLEPAQRHLVTVGFRCVCSS